ncbi:Modulator of drug activity B, putative [Trichomonas vaginalis G3]|uniref:Modulator of drug activity B, putative n=1 Tax=Trichomonas vaginalis (strain ATCC PRA-98 / G3) TaxID=412133 RepID=A2EJE6_TRIV3|nr:flavodoxin-like fold [Trichomonas vaginalis G3]EAY07203.1 Modulator of drug activity B, putative [Trichomonas vaginalis G3]KAI5533891.1 flavodoxin-like fold [Trichomonas vaginalis G3]|eukprot:XP_001319426.1 Modulator of drug activity B [Trichomonas vaginalis G3]
MRILIINGAKKQGVGNGKLNQSLVDFAVKTLTAKGHDVEVTKADSNYNPQEEVQKFVKADVLLWQFPIWWMGAPWFVKKYLEDVLATSFGTLWNGDGRSKTDPSKKYGDGGLCQNKKFMLSFTWGAPTEAITDPKQFFKGASPDSVHGPMIKSLEFVGMKQIPSFHLDDVVHNLNYEQAIKSYEQHLSKYF